MNLSKPVLLHDTALFLVRRGHQVTKVHFLNPRLYKEITCGDFRVPFCLSYFALVG